MTAGFVVRTSPHFERLFRSLQKQHPDLGALRNDVLSILSTDPYNHSRHCPIKKLINVSQGEGEDIVNFLKRGRKFSARRWDPETQAAFGSFVTCCQVTNA